MTTEKEKDQRHSRSDGQRVSGPVKTLIVDDSPFVREGLHQLAIKVPEIEIVATASDGIEAVELALLGFPELVLMDFQMPRMDGLTAARLMRAGHADIRIILMTAHELEKVKATGLGKQVDAFVSKQDVPSQLAKIVRRLFPYRFA